MPLLVIEMLQAAENVFAAHNIDYYIVGAMARDLQLSKIKGRTSSRKSKDIDLAIMVPHEAKFTELKKAFIETGHFDVHETIAIKIIFKGTLEVDLLPFGGIENTNREITLLEPRLFTMDVPGFSEVAEFVEERSIDQLKFKSCSVEGIILLKLYSWNDRNDRTKDLSDIDELITAYIDLDDKVYANYFDVMELHDEKAANYLELVSGRVIGREIAIILNHDMDKIQVIIKILEKRPVPAWSEMIAGLSDPIL